MDTEGRPIRVLESLRRDFPVALHGVSLSIASRPEPGAADRFRERRRHYLDGLARLVRRIDPFLVSDHLCWTGTATANLHDLLPTPMTDEALDWIVARVGEVQEALGRQILLENVSSYFSWKSSTWTEPAFLVEVARRSGCGILLDVNNVYVNARNHGFDASTYLASIPAEHVGQIHLAGHSDLGTHLFDTHSRPVCDAVWSLFESVVERLESVPVLIEWDADIPEFGRLEEEARRAQELAERVRAKRREHAA